MALDHIRHLVDPQVLGRDAGLCAKFLQKLDVLLTVLVNISKYSFHIRIILST